ncbi:MAG: hypothetical protein AAF591_17420 [Verrucomicrobiota bacterium]
MFSCLENSIHSQRRAAIRRLLCSNVLFEIMASITEDEITRRVNALIPDHPWKGLGWKMLFPLVALAVLLPVVLMVFPERYLPLGLVVSGLAAVYANHVRDKRVMERNYEKGLLWEELYRKSRKPHRFENCRVFHAEDHPAGYLYFLAMDDGRLIECISEDVYYGFRDGFPDELTVYDADEGDSVTLPIRQRGTGDLADPEMIRIPEAYEASTLMVYPDIAQAPLEIREAIAASEQGADEGHE